jgi:hypothetical protein
MSEGTQKMKMLRTAALAPLVLAGVLLAGAAEAQETKRLPVTASGTEQKAKFVGSLVTSSQPSKAIEASGNEQAKKALGIARGLVDQAKKDLADGKYEDADVKLNKAIEMVTAETRNVSEGDVKSGRAKDGYEKRLATVKAMMDAQTRVAKEKSITTGNATSKREIVTKYMEEAEALAKLGRYEQAIVILDKAYTSVTADVAQMRSGDKLVKELKFDTPQDEYIYEVDRNDSHVMLLKLQLSEKPPMAGYAEQIEQLRREAEDVRKQAEEQGRVKNFSEAIKTMGDSTQRLIRALRMAGAYIPGQ